MQQRTGRAPRGRTRPAAAATATHGPRSLFGRHFKGRRSSLSGRQRRHLNSRTSRHKKRAKRHTSRNERSDRRAPGGARSAICVQRLDDSLNSAIHTRYRSLLRSSSMHEPRGPPLEVVNFSLCNKNNNRRTRKGQKKKKKRCTAGAARRGEGRCELRRRSPTLGPSSTRRTQPWRRLRPSDDPNSAAGHRARDTVHGGRETKRSSLMILPQVHLRKPCYDFYFL